MLAIAAQCGNGQSALKPGPVQWAPLQRRDKLQLASEVHGFKQSWTGASTAEAQTPHLQPGMSKNPGNSCPYSLQVEQR
jgi:hypothetical protein